MWRGVTAWRVPYNLLQYFELIYTGTLALSVSATDFISILFAYHLHIILCIVLVSLCRCVHTDFICILFAYIVHTLVYVCTILLPSSRIVNFICIPLYVCYIGLTVKVCSYWLHLHIICIHCTCVGLCVYNFVTFQQNCEFHLHPIVCVLHWFNCEGVFILTSFAYYLHTLYMRRFMCVQFCYLPAELWISFASHCMCVTLV